MSVRSYKKVSPLGKNEIEKRKFDHLEICLEENVQPSDRTSGFEDILFVHNALPEINRDSIKLSTTVFSHRFSAPLLVGAMTGGTAKAFEINATLAEAVEELSLGMGVGSQRIAIEDQKLKKSFAITRKKAPSAFLIANIGAPQLVDQFGVKEAKMAVEMLEANALAIHLNPLQEAVQPEGDTNFSGVIRKIDEISQAVDVPVIVKETGSGIAAEVAKRLEKAGVAGIDVSGVGGTNWALVEYFRAKREQDQLHQRLGETFRSWGISTAASIVETAQSVDLTVIASGGIRSGSDIAKSLALGANLSSIALPILHSAIKGATEVKKTLNLMIEELKTAMFVVGAESVEKLQQVPVVLKGETSEWLRMRGFSPEFYARRKKL